MKSSEQLKEKWSAPLNSTTKSDCRAMLIEPMETKIVKPQILPGELPLSDSNRLGSQL